MTNEKLSTPEQAPAQDEAVLRVASEIINQLPPDPVLSVRGIQETANHTAKAAEAAGVDAMDVLKQVGAASPAIGAVALQAQRARLLNGIPINSIEGHRHTTAILRRRDRRRTEIATLVRTRLMRG